MSLTIPIPVDNIQLVWLLIGMSFGRNFGKKLDQGIQASEWFTNRNPIWQGIIKRTLDFFHHWWIGCIIWLYAHLWVRFLWPSLLTEITWFGVGLFIDDIRDFQHVLDRYKSETEDPKPPV